MLLPSLCARRLQLHALAVLGVGTNVVVTAGCNCTSTLSSDAACHAGKHRLSQPGQQLSINSGTCQTHKLHINMTCDRHILLFVLIRYAGFLHKHAQPTIEAPCLQHFLNMLLLQQYITFLRERGCSRATLSEQADVAIKVVTWLIHDCQLTADGSSAAQQAAEGHLVLLKRLRHQLRTCLPPSPRKPLPELVTPERLTELLLEAYEEVEPYARGEKNMMIADAIMLMRVCIACLFWGFVQPLRSSGKAMGLGPRGQD